MLELLKEADMVLSKCGRPVPPPGYRWVDLPRIIPHQVTLATATGSNVSRVQNIANTVFLCRGLAVDTISAAYRIRWPNGRVMESHVARNPIGVGQIMKALEPEVTLDPQGQIQIELNSSIGGAAGSDVVTLLFHGVLRYLLKASGDEPPSPVMSLALAPRVRRGPNQNIMAPEWLLGEQCTPECPAGYYDEPFTLFSQSIVADVVNGSLDNAVQIPGDCESFLIRRWKQVGAVYGGSASGTPAVGWRLSDGYSITGGDMVPVSALAVSNALPDVMGPFLPSLAVRGGDRMFLDVSTIAGAGAGNLTLTMRFDGVKRRRLSV